MATSTKSRPSWWWLLLPFTLCLVAVGLFVWQVMAVLSLADDFHVVHPPEQVQVTEKGVTLFVGDGFAGTAPRCSLTGPDGRRHQMEEIGFDLHVDTNNQAWNGAYESPEGLEPGSYQLECQGGAGQYGVAPQVSAGGVFGMVTLGIFVPIALVGLAFVIFLIWLVLKIVNHSKRKQQPTYAPGPGPGSYPPPGPR